MDDGVLQGALGIDDERAAQGHSLRQQHAVSVGRLASHVAEQRERQRAAEVALDPRLVAVLAVGAGAEHRRAEVLELVVVLGEAGDLRRADESEVERVEEQDNPLAAVVAEPDVHELAVLDAREREIRCRLTNLDCHTPPCSPAARGTPCVDGRNAPAPPVAPTAARRSQDAPVLSTWAAAARRTPP